jgi:hypothetical protein
MGGYMHLLPEFFECTAGNDETLPQSLNFGGWWVIKPSDQILKSKTLQVCHNLNHTM